MSEISEKEKMKNQWELFNSYSANFSFVTSHFELNIKNEESLPRSFLGRRSRFGEENYNNKFTFISEY